MTTDTKQKDQTPHEGDNASYSHEEAWLNLGRRHRHNATPRHGMPFLLKFLASIGNKLSLNKSEKIALLSIAGIFFSLVVWAGFWLKQKNHVAAGDQLVKSSSHGTYATISDFSSYWKKCSDAQGIKRGAVAIPAATIKLSKRSSTGALRFYFLNSKMKSVGDPVTLSFRDGMFSNGADTIEINASDGFHNMVDFETYQLGDLGSWDIEILEAKNEAEPRANFSLLLRSVISPSLN